MWDYVLRIVNATFSTNYTKKDVVDYDITKCPSFPKAHTDMMQALLDADGTFAEFDPYPGALEALQILNELHDVTICTSYSWSSETCCNDKLAWYREHAPFITPKQFLLGHPKYKIMCDITIDDGPDKNRHYAEHQPWAQRLSIRWPYHTGIEDVFDFLADDCMNTAQAWKQLLATVAYINDNQLRGARWYRTKFDLSHMPPHDLNL